MCVCFFPTPRNFKTIRCCRNLTAVCSVPFRFRCYENEIGRTEWVKGVEKGETSAAVEGGEGWEGTEPGTSIRSWAEPPRAQATIFFSVTVIGAEVQRETTKPTLETRKRKRESEREWNSSVCFEPRIVAVCVFRVGVYIWRELD